MGSVLAALLLFLPMGFANENADEVLFKIEKKLNTALEVRGQYSQTKFLQDVDVNLKSSGKLLFLKNKSLHFYQDKPFEQTIDFKKNNGDKKDDSLFSEILLDLFSADSKKIKKYFSASGKTTNKAWSLKLTPVNDLIKKGIKEVHIDGEIFFSKIIIKEKSGNITTLVFDNIKVKKP